MINIHRALKQVRCGWKSDRGAWLQPRVKGRPKASIRGHDSTALNVLRSVQNTRAHAPIAEYASAGRREEIETPYWVHRSG